MADSHFSGVVRGIMPLGWTGVSLEPPPGVKSNLVNPENKDPIFISICTPMSYVFIMYANRIYVKACSIRKMTWDDRAYYLLRLSCSAEPTTIFSHMLDRVGSFSGAASVAVQGPSNALTYRGVLF